MKIRGLYLLCDRGSQFVYLQLLRSGFVLRNLALQAQFARIRQLLCSAEPDIGEVAVGNSGKRAGTANAELLYRKLWVWQRCNLLRHMTGGVPGILGSCHLGIVLLRFMAGFTITNALRQSNQRASEPV